MLTIPAASLQAAEAMGAISAFASLPVLREFLKDENRAVRETCEIAIARIEWDASEEGRKAQQAQKDPEEIPCVALLLPLPPPRLSF